jgi:hypothetical protein
MVVVLIYVLAVRDGNIYELDQKMAAVKTVDGMLKLVLQCPLLPDEVHGMYLYMAEPHM